MTATLMGRLFIVPALVVCVMLGVAVVVVLFGASSIEKPESINQLLTRIESDSGEKTLGVMLLPRPKDAWQAAQELARRFSQKGKYLAADEIDPVAARIIRIIERDVNTDGSQRAHGLTQRLFLIRSLGKLAAPSSVRPLTAYLQDSNPRVRLVTLQALAEMRDLPEARSALPGIYPLLDDPNEAVRMVACLAVASLAKRGDPVAVGHVARKIEAGAETQWNAAIALARLGSKRGKLVLMNMLDRGFWARMDLGYEESGNRVRRKLTDVEIADRLRATIDAASYLEDDELSKLIVNLREKDPALAVREAARQALERKSSDASGQVRRPDRRRPESSGSMRTEVN